MLGFDTSGVRLEVKNMDMDIPKSVEKKKQKQVRCRQGFHHDMGSKVVVYPFSCFALFGRGVGGCVAAADARGLQKHGCLRRRRTGGMVIKTCVAPDDP